MLRARQDLDWVPRPNIDILDPYFRRPKSVPPDGVRTIWPEIVNAHRLVRIPKDKAYFHDTRWDEVSLDQLHLIPVEAVRLICAADRPDADPNDPPWRRRCGHQCDAAVGFLLKMARQIKDGQYLKFAEIRERLYCSRCGNFDPIMLPMRLRVP